MIPKAVTHGPKRPFPPLRQFTVDNPILGALWMLITGWWCNRLEKYESQWEGWHPIIMEKMFETTNRLTLSGLCGKSVLKSKAATLRQHHPTTSNLQTQKIKVCITKLHPDSWHFLPCPPGNHSTDWHPPWPAPYDCHPLVPWWSFPPPLRSSGTRWSPPGTKRCLGWRFWRCHWRWECWRGRSSPQM